MRTMRLPRSIGRRGVVALAGALGLSACSSADTGEPPVDAPAERRALLRSVTDRVLVPAYAELADAAAALEAATADYAAEISEARAAAVTTAFARFADAAQAAEVYQIGPYGAASRFAGGQNIRDELYSWPVVNPCRVDRETLSTEYEVEDFFERKLVNVYGLDALEYLLFDADTDNACPASQGMDPEWEALGDAEIRDRRAAYAAVVSAQLRREADRLVEAWRDGFADALIRAGDGSTVYRTSQQALDELFASMFYVEKQVKDTKLGAPLGITAECADAVCPDLLESQHARLSGEWVGANLRAFVRLYYGGAQDEDGRFGFDGLLRASGAFGLADDFDARIADALTALDALPSPLAEHLDAPEAVDLHAALREIATLLKTQFVSVLALRVPDEGAADND